jgi:tetratricopeptide (TPR) repeat protein
VKQRLLERSSQKPLIPAAALLAVDVQLSLPGGMLVKWTGVAVALGALVLMTSSGVAQAQTAPDGAPENPDLAACQDASKDASASVEACTRLIEQELRDSARRQAVLVALRGLAWKAKGEGQNALNDFSQAIALDSTFAPAYEERGDLLRDNNQCELALTDYDHAILLQPERAPTYISRSACLISNRGFDRARADLDQVIKLDGDKADGLAPLAWTIKGQLDANKGDLDHALEDYDEAIRLNPKQPATYIDRGAVWARKGDNDKAAADLDQAIKLDEKNAGGYAVAALTTKARLDFSTGNPERAIADYDEAIRLDPQRAALYLGRAALRKAMADFDHAAADYDEAIKVEPKSALAHDARGDFYSARGDYDRALVDYDKAIESEPDDLAAYSNRALARFYKGEFAKAIDDFVHVTGAQANAYPMLLLYLSRAHAGRKDATPELAKSLDKLKASDWPYPVVELYLGRKTADAVLAAATTPGQKCEAQFYIGEWQLTRDAKPAAQKALQTAIDTCPKDFVEYRGAVEELKRLK